MSDTRQVLLCRCAYSPVIPAEVKRKVFSGLSGAGLRLTVVPDLCELAAHRDARLAEWASHAGLVVIACYPRAVRWLFHAAGVSLPAGAQVLNMRELTADTVLERLGIGPAPAGETPEPAAVAPSWLPWFPVIDYDRCRGCLQCLSFCPFGVYEQDADRRVIAANPDRCKNNCPACARICPEIAIVFPKCPDTPIQGAEVNPEDESRRKKALADGSDGLDILLAKRKARAEAFRRARQGSP